MDHVRSCAYGRGGTMSAGKKVENKWSYPRRHCRGHALSCVVREYLPCGYRPGHGPCRADMPTRDRAGPT